MTKNTSLASLHLYSIWPEVFGQLSASGWCLTFLVRINERIRSKSIRGRKRISKEMTYFLDILIAFVHIFFLILSAVSFQFSKLYLLRNYFFPYFPIFSEGFCQIKTLASFWRNVFRIHQSLCASWKFSDLMWIGILASFKTVSRC